MLNYMKWCYDGDKEFPWESTFPADTLELSKEKFIEYYTKEIHKYL